MKYIIFLLLVLLSFGTYSQTPFNRSSPAVTAIDSRLIAKLNLGIPVVFDTTLNGGLDSLGSIVYSTLHRSVFFRDSVTGAGHRWTKIISVNDTAAILSPFYKQGGNSFGTIATLGTKDNNRIDFISNGTIRGSLLSNGRFTFGTTTAADSGAYISQWHGPVFFRDLMRIQSTSFSTPNIGGVHGGILGYVANNTIRLGYGPAGEWLQIGPSNAASVNTEFRAINFTAQSTVATAGIPHFKGVATGSIYSINQPTTATVQYHLFTNTPYKPSASHLSHSVVRINAIDSLGDFTRSIKALELDFTTPGGTHPADSVIAVNIITGRQRFGTRAFTGTTSSTRPLLTIDDNGYVDTVSRISLGGGINQLTGDVQTPLGTGSQPATIAVNAVTNTKFRQSVASSLVGNSIGSTANVQDISLGYGLNFNGTSIEVDTSSANGLATQYDLSQVSGGGSSVFASSGAYKDGDTVKLVKAILNSLQAAYYIACWGDSFTETPTNDPYPSKLQRMQVFRTFNGGASGETSGQIMTRMIADTAKYHWPAIIWSGRNDARTVPNTVLANIKRMVDSLKSRGNNRYIILGILNGAYHTERLGTVAHDSIVNLNSYLATIYTDHFIDVRPYIVSKYDPGIAQDVIDFANDVPPSSLRSDSLHLNSAGQQFIADTIAKKIALLNNTIFEETKSVVLTTKDIPYIFQAAPPIGTNSRSVANFSGLNVRTLAGVSSNLDIITDLNPARVVWRPQGLDIKNFQGSAGGISLQNATPITNQIGVGQGFAISGEGYPTTTGATNMLLTHVSSLPQSGTSYNVRINGNCFPSGGTGQWNALGITGTINQVGGASGITRGFLINHTITAAADYRAFEVITGRTVLRQLTLGTGAISPRMLYSAGSIGANKDTGVTKIIPLPNHEILVYDTTTERFHRATVSAIVDGSDGEYTPTITNVANLDASTAYPLTYQRKGQSVTIGGQIDIDPTAVGTIELRFTLPPGLGSAFSTTAQAGGSGADGAGVSYRVHADPVNDEIIVVGTVTQLTNYSFSFSFTYRIIAP